MYPWDQKFWVIVMGPKKPSCIVKGCDSPQVIVLTVSATGAIHRSKFQPSTVNYGLSEIIVCAKHAKSIAEGEKVAVEIVSNAQEDQWLT